jgi:hypothetical protein
MDNTTDNVKELRERLNNKVHLVLADGKYFERINPDVKEVQEKQFYTIGQGTIWVTNGKYVPIKTNSLGMKKTKKFTKRKIFNIHGVYEITADEDSLTGTFSELKCDYTDTDISKCQVNVKASILDQFTITTQVAVKVTDGELKFGLNSVTLYTVKGEKKKICDNNSCHILFTHTVSIYNTGIADKSTYITFQTTPGGVSNTVYKVDNTVDINQFKAAVAYFSSKKQTGSLTMRLNLDKDLFEYNPYVIINEKTKNIENNAFEITLLEG